MNMKTTKIVSGLLATALAALSLGMNAFAADGVSVKIGSTNAEAGSTFTVDVDLAGVPSTGLSSIDFAINYDKSVIEITSVKLGTVGETGAAAQEGDLGDTLFSTYDTGKQIVVVWATGLTDSKYWVSKDGAFLTITGKVKDGASGTTKLSGVAADRAVYPGASEKASTYFSAVGADKTTDYTATFTDGVITIGGKEETTAAPVETTKPDETKAPNGDADWGNADCTGGVDVGDAVLIARFAAEDAEAKITAQGQINADVTHDGNIKGDDATKILKYVAKLITKDDLAKA
jgi:hypothetical protein